MKKDGPDVELDVYSFMTTAPNALDGLEGSPAEAFALARSIDAGAMPIVQSGFEKKDLLAA